MLRKLLLRMTVSSFYFLGKKKILNKCSIFRMTVSNCVLVGGTLISEIKRMAGGLCLPSLKLGRSAW